MALQKVTEARIKRWKWIGKRVRLVVCTGRGKREKLTLSKIKKN
jgi:hypothetical protein